MKIFFDSEFTGLNKNANLISLGMIAENGDTFYAEFEDYYEEGMDINDWIRENVIANLSRSSKELKSLANCTVKGYGFIILDSLMDWLEKFDYIELVSDVCHYDFVFLIDIIAGNALNMPKNISPVCHDINYDIARYFGISETEAFNKSREEILKHFGITIKGKKHNAIYDAKVIKAIYDEIAKRQNI